MDVSDGGWSDEPDSGFFDYILPKEEEGKKGVIANLRIGSRSNI